MRRMIPNGSLILTAVAVVALCSLSSATRHRLTRTAAGNGEPHRQADRPCRGRQGIIAGTALAAMAC